MRLSRLQPAHGPESIESARDEVIASAALLDEIIRAEQRGVDAHIIACFGGSGAGCRPGNSASARPRHCRSCLPLCNID
ncbi:hypothetical protein P4S72_13930 [Vibrio sp. PP-XX7]